MKKTMKSTTASVAVLTALLSLSGCVTTEKLADGSTRVSLNTDPRLMAKTLKGESEPLAKAAPLVDEQGNVSLIPQVNPLGRNRGNLYLGGRFNYSCMTEFVYSAKSGLGKLRDRADEACKQDYLARQSELRRKGLPHDAAAPVYGSNRAEEDAYWNALSVQTVSDLSRASQFSIRFAKIVEVAKDGGLSIQPSIGEAVTNDYVRMMPVPASVPVIIEDAAFASRLSSDPDKRKTGVGDWVSCDAVWHFVGTKDRNTGYSYGRYEVQFATKQMGCQEARPSA